MASTVPGVYQLRHPERTVLYRLLYAWISPLKSLQFTPIFAKYHHQIHLLKRLTGCQTASSIRPMLEMLSVKNKETMRKCRSLFLAATLILFSAVLASAQTDTASHTVTMTVNAIAVLDITGGNINLIIEAPGTGGQTPSNDTDTTCRLQYTTTVASSLTRTITVAWGGSDAAPAGTSLRVQVAPSGQTNEGSTAGQRTISSSAQTVITGIGSCATGTSGSSGALLTYTLSVDTMTSLVAGESQSATVTYTLTDDA